MKQHNISNLDGVWNLVLACSSCNSKKNAQRPHSKYLEKLYRRNEFYIGSNHPLKETLINQTGDTPKKRRAFLLNTYQKVGELGLLQSWQVDEVEAKAF